MKLPTDIIAIKQPLPFATFVSYYQLAKRKKCQNSLELLIGALNFQFLLWQEKFDQSSYEDDITLLTLFSLLKIDNKPKDTLKNKIKNLKKYLKDNSLNFYDLCIEAFLRHMRKPTKVYNNYKTEIKFYYFLSKEIKMFLFKRIRFILQKNKTDFFSNPSPIYQQNTYRDYYIDSTYLDYLCNHNNLLFSAYMFFLATCELKAYMLKDKYKLSAEESKKLKEDLCQLIKILLSNN